MSDIADYTESELWTINSTLQERYGEPVELELAAAEMRLNAMSSQMVDCPVAFWLHKRCNFVIIKTGEDRYRAQFFFRVHQQYGTGVEEYDNLSDCIVSLLQVQADFVRDQKMEEEAGGDE